MMNKMIKKIAIAFAAATMTLTSVTCIASANSGTGIDSMEGVSVTECDAIKYVNSQAGANVRTAPGTSARILKCLGYNTQLHVVGVTNNGWYEIITSDPVYGGETAGYISGDLLSDNKGNQNTPSQNQNVNPNYSWIKETNSSHSSQVKEARGEMSHDNDTFTANVSSGYLALRSAPETNPANEIGQIENGQMVQVQQYGSQFDYVYVPRTGAYGYVNNDYLA